MCGVLRDYITFKNEKKMSKQDKRLRKQNLWVAIGAVVLIILLIVWLTMADLWGDTDVAAFIPGLL